MSPSTSIYGTPSRSERSSETFTSASHFPPPSGPNPSIVSTPPTNKDRLLTTAYFLEACASAQDPKMAALEQAVNDRNVLSSQNAQLWKLIEKQRAGYNQILKDLERVRGERDAYKTKVHGASGNAEKRYKSDVDHSSKRSISEHNALTSVESNSSNSAAQYASKDHPTPRNVHNVQLHSSKSQEPLVARDSSLQHNAGSPTPRSQTLPLPPSSSTSQTPHMDVMTPHTRSTKQSPSLFLSPSTESLPLIQYTSASAFQDPVSAGPADLADLPSTRPLALYPRKSSLPDSVNSSGINANTNSYLPNVSYNTPPSTSSISTSSPPQNHYGSDTTSQTAPTGSDDHPVDILQSVPRAATLPQPYPQIPATPSNLLSTIVEGRPSILSRDSRISLPDEAKQYIANMTESPVPSPKFDAFVSKTGPSTHPLYPQEHISETVSPNAIEVKVAGSPGESSEFLDMNEDDDGGDESNSDEDDADDDESIALEIEDVTDKGSLQDTPRQPAQVILQVGNPQMQSFSKQKLDVIAHAQQPYELTSTGISATSPIEGEIRSMGGHTPGYPALPGHPNNEDIAGPLENPYSPPGQNQPQALQPMRLNSNNLHEQSMTQSVPAHFRALPLLQSDLPSTVIIVSHSFVRPNDRGKEVLSFVVHVDPGSGKDGWKVEKMYSDVLGLDQRVRSVVGKGIGKKISSLPEGKLWKDHAPAKVDQRKAVLEQYLQQLVNLPVKDNNEVIAFFTSDIVREAKQPVMQVGHKEGYLTKRGKNFGGWKTRYFVLQGPVLEYYDCRGGAHLGSIVITGAQIGRQQRSERAPSTDEEKEYRHAFLIVEAKKGPGGSHPRHVLCAESDDDRDAWVEMLVRYFTGTYSEEPFKYPPLTNIPQNGAPGLGQPRSSTSSSVESPTTRRSTRGFSKDDISISKGAAVPISQLPPDQTNAKFFTPPVLTSEEYTRSSSPSKYADSPIDPQNTAVRRLMDRGQPSSMPDSSPLSSVSNFHEPSASVNQRANSELGHYPDLDSRGGRQVSPERHRSRDPHEKHKSFYPTLNPATSSPVVPIERTSSPDKLEATGKVKISGPLNGAPIPSGFKFGRDNTSALESNATDRRLKSRSFWGFGRPNAPATTYIPRAVFGVTLEDSLDVAQIANLPAIVFRCIQYLEAKKAEQEEGIYRLSGSSAVIKNLKDRFNMEGDVDLLASDEYWDPHAIAGLLKSFLRELPASILTRDLHLRFLAVIDFVNAQERIKELSQLIAALPLANYSLLRALTAHLILIVQNASVNKMTMRNVGIVFSPTLGIPAGVFSLMLGEFNRVFNVDADPEDNTNNPEKGGENGIGLDRRNSKHYSDTATDQLLGLAGRSLKAAVREIPSDGDDLSVHEESGAETTDGDLSSSESAEYSTSTQPDEKVRVTPPDTPLASKTKVSKASTVAATRGLNLNVDALERGNGHSKMVGLPTSPRPIQTSSSEVPPSPSQVNLI